MGLYYNINVLGRFYTGTKYCRVHSILSAAGTRHSVRSSLPTLGVGPHRPSGKHSRVNGQREISQVGEHALSKHSGGQIACSQGRTNSMFLTMLAGLHPMADVPVTAFEPPIGSGNPMIAKAEMLEIAHGPQCDRMDLPPSKKTIASTS